MTCCNFPLPPPAGAAFQAQCRKEKPWSRSMGGQSGGGQNDQCGKPLSCAHQGKIKWKT